MTVKQSGVILHVTLYEPVLVNICLEPMLLRWQAIVSTDVTLFNEPESRCNKQSLQTQHRSISVSYCGHLHPMKCLPAHDESIYDGCIAAKYQKFSRLGIPLAHKCKEFLWETIWTRFSWKLTAIQIQNIHLYPRHWNSTKFKAFKMFTNCRNSSKLFLIFVLTAN
jgi:hypothetical protein